MKFLLIAAEGIFLVYGFTACSVYFLKLPIGNVLFASAFLLLIFTVIALYHFVKTKIHHAILIAVCIFSFVLGFDCIEKLAGELSMKNPSVESIE